MSPVFVVPEYRRAPGFNAPAMVLSLLVLGAALLSFVWAANAGITAFYYLGGILAITGALIPAALKMANQWERAVVLRLGRLQSIAGPGMFWIVPVFDQVAYWLDQRIQTTEFNAQQALSKDTVPVDVDAVLFWRVVDPQRAALDVEDYRNAISWAAQTALRDVIGKTMLADMLEGREKISRELGRIIDERATPWGVNVISVELKDVLIPASLEDAMSMQAQAERERQARIILGDSERQVAEKFQEAARTYADDPTAFHLRAMNMLYEGLKQNSTIVVVPSTAVETMNLGGLAGVTALGLETKRGQGRSSEPKPGIRPAA